MKALLLHPGDSPLRGPWRGQHWDLLVDLGKSSEFAAAAWQNELGSSVVRLASFRQGLEDPRRAGAILHIGRGRVLDGEGLDWWELTSLFIHEELETSLALCRMRAAIASSADEFCATRKGWPVDGLAILLGREVKTFESHNENSWTSRFAHYRQLLHRMAPAQLTEILLDKYDADYRWRARWTVRQRRADRPIVLLPSAYTNVSRMAAAYARLLPEQEFLLVFTRVSGKQFVRPANVRIASLAAYAGTKPSRTECQALLERWRGLRGELERLPELDLLSRLGIWGRFEKWFADGLAVRNAWLHVLQQEPLQAILCGDDSNWYTRLPVVLARKRGLPTLDFHHGALDGRYLLKNLPSDFYLAKSEMERDYLTRVCGLPEERVLLGGPSSGPVLPNRQKERDAIVFFSEPYEASGGRPEEIYRELLPPLARLAENSGRNLIVKLHPFESVKEREGTIRQVLPPAQQHRIELRAGPLTDALLQRAWFGITVESTTVVECSMWGVPCFLAAWVAHSPYGYPEQYAKFGIGRLLHAPEEIAALPGILAQDGGPTAAAGAVWQPMDAEQLRALLTRTAELVK